MCGIAGVFGTVDESVLDKMLNCITHRGPDESGRHVDADASLMMGMRRLSIVDLDTGSQPIHNEDGSVTVVFNGEIYNHDALRADLEAEGHQFTTESDTEVLVHLWEEYGERTPEHLDGMFAFAIWDANQESLFLARDRLGIKPLYYGITEEGFVWGSEMAPLLIAGVDRSIDETAVYNYFSLRYSPSPQTLVSGASKLRPGTSLLVTADDYSHRQYWELPAQTVSGNADAIADRVRSLLESSVEQRLMADVPVGSFLSGGLDSSAIVGLASEQYDGQLQTFSVGFEGASYDESDEAAFVADHFGTDHNELTVDLSSMDAFSDLIEHYGEPLADPAALPTMLLSQYASEKVKVVLTGEGADELFAGYRRHRSLPTHRKFMRAMPGQAFDAFERLEELTPLGKKYFRYASSMESDERAVIESARRFSDLRPEEYIDMDTSPDTSNLSLLVENAFDHAAEDDLLQRLTAFDILYWLPDDLLYKVDRASMASSLEARVPFLNHELVSFAHSIPSSYKKQGYKSVLRRAVSDIVPDRTLERDKQGFDVPVTEWFREDPDAIAQHMTEEQLDPVPYIDADKVLDIRRAHRRRKADHGMTLWKVLNYVAWYHEYLGKYDTGSLQTGRSSIQWV